MPICGIKWNSDNRWIEKWFISQIKNLTARRLSCVLFYNNIKSELKTLNYLKKKKTNGYIKNNTCRHIGLTNRLTDTHRQTNKQTKQVNKPTNHWISQLTNLSTQAQRQRHRGTDKANKDTNKQTNQLRNKQSKRRIKKMTL